MKLRRLILAILVILCFPVTTSLAAKVSPTAKPHTTIGTLSATDSLTSNVTREARNGSLELTQNGTQIYVEKNLDAPMLRLQHRVYSIHLVSLNYDHVRYPLVFTLVVIFAGLSKVVFHHLHFLSSKIPESCCLIAIGLVLGCIIYFSGVGEDLEFFSPHEFFLFLLPPIILESAFSLHDRTFAENIGSVLLFAVLGTVLACFSVGLTLFGLYKAGAMEEINCSIIQILVFSSLIVAVDPVAVLAVFQEVGVNKILYFLVFGESLLNDGVTVVLYDVMQKLNRMENITPPQIILGVGKFFIVVLCGLAIGIFCGILSSLLTRFSNSVKVVEPLLIFGLAYLSFILSELFEVSGIIRAPDKPGLDKLNFPSKISQELEKLEASNLASVKFFVRDFSGTLKARSLKLGMQSSMIGCGLVQAHYAFLNVTSKSRAAVKFFAKVMSYELYDKYKKRIFRTTCEIVIFLFLGLITWKSHHKWVTGFTFWTLVLCIFYRFLITFGLSFLLNKLDTSRVRKIKYDEMFMMSYGGLRGAVCFSLVALLDSAEFPMKNMFVTTTIFVIFFTVFIQGGTVKWLVHLLSVNLEERSKYISLNTELTEHVSDHVLAGIESIVGQAGSHFLKVHMYGRVHLLTFESDFNTYNIQKTKQQEQINLIDDRYIRPKLQQNVITSDLEDITKHYEKLVMKEHYKHLQLCGAKLPKVEPSIRQLDSEIALDRMVSKEEMDLPEQKNKEKKKESKVLWHKAVKKVSVVTKIEELPDDNGRVRQIVRNIIERSKQKPDMKVFRNNSILDRQGSFINHMRQKHNKNKELNQMKSSTLGKHTMSPRTHLCVPDPASMGEDVHYVDDDTACGIHITVEDVDKVENGSGDEQSGISIHAHRLSETEADDEFKDF